jgi:hypothetical protein
MDIFRRERVVQQSFAVVITFYLLVTATCLISCQNQVETFNVYRDGVFSYSRDTFITEYANDVIFYKGESVQHNYSPVKSEIYRRLLLEAKGLNQSGKKVIIDLTIDILPNDSGKYIGVYKTEYKIGFGGIHSFNLLEETAVGTYKSYSLDPAYLSEAFFQIERQNIEEQLLLGRFFAKLQNDQNSSEKLTLYNGTFKDIHYEK